MTRATPNLSARLTLALVVIASVTFSTIAAAQSIPKPSVPSDPPKPQPGQLETAKPNFSGKWRMVKSKSEFGGFPMPDTIVRTVEHKDPTMNVHTVQSSGLKTTAADVSYFTDGSQSSNTINGKDAVSKAYWDGPALNIRTEMTDQTGAPVVLEDRWELSEDQKTLMTTSHVSTTKGTADLKLVSERE